MHDFIYANICKGRQIKYSKFSNSKFECLKDSQHKVDYGLQNKIKDFIFILRILSKVDKNLIDWQKI